MHARTHNTHTPHTHTHNYTHTITHTQYTHTHTHTHTMCIESPPMVNIRQTSVKWWAVMGSAVWRNWQVISYWVQILSTSFMDFLYDKLGELRLRSLGLLYKRLNNVLLPTGNLHCRSIGRLSRFCFGFLWKNKNKEKNQSKFFRCTRQWSRQNPCRRVSQTIITWLVTEGTSNSCVY